MAIYHYSMKVIKRSAGRSSTAAAAYRAGLDITDERTGEVHRYANRGGVLDHAILTPPRAPDWAKEAGSLWNAVEGKENRKDAQLARENVVALPHELSLEQNRALLHGFVQEAYIKRGMAAQVDIHQHSVDGDSRNIHAHIMLTMRGMSRNGWKEKKARVWNERETLKEWRALWAAHVNRALEQAHVKDRVSEKSFKDLGLDKQPSKHLGPEATEMERRGENSRLGDENRAADNENRKMAELEAQSELVAGAIREEAFALAEEKRREEKEQHKAYLEAQEARRELAKEEAEISAHAAFLAAQDARRQSATKTPAQEAAPAREHLREWAEKERELLAHRQHIEREHRRTELRDERKKYDASKRRQWDPVIAENRKTELELKAKLEQTGLRGLVYRFRHGAKAQAGIESAIKNQQEAQWRLDDDLQARDAQDESKMVRQEIRHRSEKKALEARIDTAVEAGELPKEQAGRRILTGKRQPEELNIDMGIDMTVTYE